MANDLDGIAVFVAVAETQGFRTAGERLGVSASAVSQSLRRFEKRMGVTLVRRTTRSVRLTDAGAQLFASVRPALEDMRAAVESVSELSDEPRGTVRLLISPGAELFLRDEVLARFLTAYPQIHLDLAVTSDIADIVGNGYDAGIQLGEVIDRDMIAVPVSGDLTLMVVGAPSYFARHRKARHPRELVEHECVNWHQTPSSPPYRWEFTENGRDFSVAVPTRVLTTDPALLVRLARAGVGLAMVYAEQVREDVARGDLVPILEEYSTPFPGFYLYYPNREHVSTALRAFVDYLRQARQSTRKVRPSRNRR
jgi:DNA-binding transcriptional LysR family regulator